MKKMGAILVAMCLAAACFAMAGCGGNSAVDPVGTWELSGGTQADGTEVTAEDIEKVKERSIELGFESGLDFSYTFEKDGSVESSMFGLKSTGTWKAVDATTLDITIGDQTQQGKIENGTLTLTIEGATYNFTKTS